MILKTFSEFIRLERDKFDDEDNNKFAFAFGDILRYREFIEFIVERYRELSNSVDGHYKIQQTLILPGEQSVSPELAISLEMGRELNARLQLEIESYYLFAKILLDQVAHALEAVFGQGRGVSLDSHDQLTKSFSKYVKEKALVVGDGLTHVLTALKKDVADFRDYQIAHEKSPRTIRGISFGKGESRMILTKIYPKESDGEQKESKNLNELTAEIDKYLVEITNFVRTNIGKTKLKRGV